MLIDIPIPDGWEFVGYRVAAPGEYFFVCGEIFKCSCTTLSAQIVVRQTWKWPEWLKAKYIAMDESGCWYAYNCKPSITDYYWQQAYFLDESLIDFSPPPCDDWKESLRENPNNG